MDSGGALLQFIGSLAAILLLAGAAHWLKLGGAPRIATVPQAMALARQVADDFDAVDCSIDAKGLGAVLADGQDRIMVLKSHGSHFAGRIIQANHGASLASGRLLIETGERSFGTVALDLPDAQRWEVRIRALGGASNA